MGREEGTQNENMVIGRGERLWVPDEGRGGENESRTRAGQSCDIPHNHYMSSFRGIDLLHIRNSTVTLYM